LSSVTLSATITYSGTIVSFVVPVTGTYDIAAAGASGGGDLGLDGVSSGGLGGKVAADFALVQGETLEIAVGGAGQSISFSGGGGGGGGSFVVLIDGGQQTVLEVAGGGGGGGFANNGGAGGAQPAGSGQGGAGGGPSGGGGGGGFFSNGGDATRVTFGTAIDSPAKGGQDFSDGLGGGAGEFYSHFEASFGGAGGFGGGGGGGAFGAPGGGGGYDGGAPGQGGTSFIAATAIDPALTPGVATAGEVVIDYPACFLAGTRLATPGGEVAIEALRAGDLVSVIDGPGVVARPVRWIGHRRIDVARHRQPALVQPIRIRRDAVAAGVPRRDLLVSPDHAIFADGVLIPARQLVNHASIVQDAGPAFADYLHVELDRHALLLAEGLATESYLDTGNRALFDNGGAALLLHPQFTPNAGLRCWQTDACARLAVDAATVQPVWQRLAARAARRGSPAWQPATTDVPDLRLEVQGRTLRPVGQDATRAVFALPPGAREVRLRSRAVVASARQPWLDDRRRLGVAVAGLRVSLGADLHAIAPDDPALTTGWWPSEGGAGRVWRWTDGDARLTLPPGAIGLEVRLAGTMVYPLAEAPARPRPARPASIAGAMPGRL
jgi:hypothetical protein